MKSTFFPYAFFEGNVVRTEEAKVSIMTNALQYGTGVFGGIRGYYDKKTKTISVFRPLDHAERLLNSLKILGVSIPYTKEQIADILKQLIKKNKPAQNVYFRPFAYAGSLSLAPNLSRDKEFSLAIYMIPLDDYLPTDKGLSVKVSSWNRISDNSIPARGKITGGYINSALARKEAADNGYDEAIVLTDNGHVAEGSAENVFMVRKEKLITPSVSDNVLEGITRSTVMEIARVLKIEVVERSIDRSELYIADELFFSGTGVQIAWISSVDKHVISGGTMGSVTKRIAALYFSIVYGKNKAYSKWLMKIPV